MKKLGYLVVLFSLILSVPVWACDGNKDKDEKGKDGKTTQSTTQTPTTAQAPAPSGK
jgi:hypothetical protein